MENQVLLPQGAVMTDENGRAGASSRQTEADLRASALDPERTSVFTSLVREDGDIAGLVAYSIYKQNKLDWLQAFEVAKGRAPNDDELASYIIGESTPRRLATYRHLAETTLAGKGPEIGGSASRPARDRLATSQPVSTNTVALYAIIAVLAVIVLWLATHTILAGR